MSGVTSFLGALFGCILLTAGAYRVLRRAVKGWLPRLLTASAMVLVFATVVGGFGFAVDKSNPAFGLAFQTYLIPEVAAFCLWAFLSYGEK